MGTAGKHLTTNLPYMLHHRPRGLVEATKIEYQVLDHFSVDCINFFFYVRFLTFIVSDMEVMKERFARLLLGEDMSGGNEGVSSALALSNAITNLAGRYLTLL